MQTEIIVAIIAFIGTLAGSYFANSKTTAVMHNLVERMSAVEQSTKSAHHRIDHLEG